MKTIYSEVHELIESGYSKFICNAVNYKSSYSANSVESRVILQEIQLALTTTDGETQGTVEALLYATAYKDVEIAYEEFKELAKSWRLNWLQRKHENATIKFTHEKYLPTEVRAKRQYIEDLVQIKHYLETAKGEPWVCDAIKYLDLQHRQELEELVDESLGRHSAFITSVPIDKGATYQDEPRGLVFPDAPFITRTQYRIGWIDWLIHNTED